MSHKLDSDLTVFLFRGVAAGVSAELGGDDIARICIECKADIIMVQNEQILKKVIYILTVVYTVIRGIWF